MNPEAILLARVRALRDLPAPNSRKATREAAGVSQGDCAEVLGVSQQAFARWEHGDRTPSGEHLTAYVKLLRSLQQAMAA